MNKTLLLSAFVALCTAQGAYAQLTTHDFKDATFTDDLYGEAISAGGQFNHVSGNGQYAVGYDDQFIVAYQGGAYLWKRTAPDKLEFINTSANRISACDVTNDGTIVGSFEEREDAETESECYPGWRTTDGLWHQLPLPDNYSLKAAKDQMFMEEGRAVTPDGKYIAGNIHIVVDTKDFQGTTLEVLRLTPVLWEKQGDDYILKQLYTGLGKAGVCRVFKDGKATVSTDSINYGTFLVWDISNDGQTIVGMNQASNGVQTPAYIRNGVLTLYVNPDTYEDFAYNTGGICSSIDANGNIYGYYADDKDQRKYFYITPDEKIVYLDNLTSCAAKDGTQFAATSILPYVLDCSEDGQVVAGAGIGVTDYGQFAYPMIASNDDASAIDRTQAAAGVSVDLHADGTLYVNGLYTKAWLYNAAGVLNATAVQGQTLSVKTLPAGTYIVKVETKDGVKTFKVAK